MNIVACYKIVPDAQDIEVGADGALRLDRAQWVLGEYDLAAIEAAAQLAAATDGGAVLLSAGGEKLNDTKLVKAALSRGADELYRVVDPALEDADAFQTASVLAAALRAGAFVFAAYATGRVLSRRARAGDERRIEQLRRECGTDMLTGLLNRRGGQEKAETMLAMCRRCEKPMAVLMADIDHFKEYNDAYGHLAGDGALCRVGGALQSVLARSSDMVCRFGGEEFLLCTPCRDTAEAMRQAARLRRAVEELGPCAPDGCCAGPLTVSVGVTVYSPARDGSAPVLQDLVSRADRALYIAKKNGRNCVVLL